MQSKTLHAVSLTLYGCATAGGTVTATLSRDGSTVDTATQTVTVVPPGISIEISDLVSSLVEGETDRFEVTAENLESSERYKILLTSSNDSFGFHGYCWLERLEFNVPADRTNDTISTSLKACATPGDTVKATLLSDGREIVSATQYLTVQPDLSPKVAMSGFWDGIYKIGAGYRDFTVSATHLDPSTSYKIKITMDDDEPGNNIGISFDSGCSDQEEEVTVSVGATSYTGDFNIEPCDGTNGTVTAKLLLADDTEVDSATHNVTVREDVRPRLYGPDNITVGSSAELGFILYGLDSTKTYTVLFETSVAGIGFNSGCSVRSKTVTLSGKTSYWATADDFAGSDTLHGCTTGRGSVTAKVYRGGSVQPNAHRTEYHTVNVRN